MGVGGEGRGGGVKVHGAVWHKQMEDGSIVGGEEGAITIETCSAYRMQHGSKLPL